MTQGLPLSPLPLNIVLEAQVYAKTIKILRTEKRETTAIWWHDCALKKIQNALQNIDISLWIW